VWLVVPGSISMSVTGVGGASAIELMESVRDWGSHSLDYVV
jgi:hypothetical protein